MWKMLYPRRDYRMKYLLALSILGSTAFAESRKIIAVVDTGINWTDNNVQYRCDLPDYDFSIGVKGYNPIPHGTNVATEIFNKIDPKTHCVVSIKWFNTRDTQPEVLLNSTLKALAQANALNASYLNLSYQDGNYSSQEKKLIGTALRRGAIVVVAAGNRGTIFDYKHCDLYPACYHFNSLNYHVVADVYSFSNDGYNITDRIDSRGRGTSFSAAILTGQLASQQL